MAEVRQRMAACDVWGVTGSALLLGWGMEKHFRCYIVVMSRTISVDLVYHAIR